MKGGHRETDACSTDLRYIKNFDCRGKTIILRYSTWNCCYVLKVDRGHFSPRDSKGDDNVVYEWLPN